MQHTGPGEKRRGLFVVVLAEEGHEGVVVGLVDGEVDVDGSGHNHLGKLGSNVCEPCFLCFVGRVGEFKEVLSVLLAGIAEQLFDEFLFLISDFVLCAWRATSVCHILLFGPQRCCGIVDTLAEG